MSAKQKITKGWAILYPRGYVHIWAIRPTRRAAKEAFCENGTDSTPDDWNDWAKRGYRAVKVEIREAT